MAEQATRKIDVMLNVGANPEVEVTSLVDGDSKIQWKKDPDSADFDIVSLDINETVFTNKEVGPQKKKIEVKDDTSQTGEYPYTLTVKTADGVEHNTTTQSEDPTGDKPVIRNQ
jgi:hypothetical protein